MKLEYEKWALDLCSLLDAVEMALNENDLERAKDLVHGRSAIELHPRC